MLSLGGQSVLFLTNQFNKLFACTQFKWSNISIWLIDITLSGATTPGQGVPGSNGNEEVLYITQNFRVEALP